MRQIRNQLAKGSSYDQACGALTGITREMKGFIMEDYLKIFIAEEHFGSGLEIDDMALCFGLPYEKVEDAMAALLREIRHEVHMTAAGRYQGTTLTH